MTSERPVMASSSSGHSAGIRLFGVTGYTNREAWDDKAFPRHTSIG